MIKKLKQINLGNYITSQVLRSNDMYAPLSSVYTDMRGIWDAVKSYEPALMNTPSYTGIDIANGISAMTLLVEPNSVSGRFYDALNQRPKTIGQCMDELYSSTDVSLTEVPDIGIQLANIKQKIGSELFDLESATPSLLARINDLEMKTSQLAADVFNDASGEFAGIGSLLDPAIYKLSSDGKQTQALSIKDILSMLAAEHSGYGRMNHADMMTSTVWALSTGPTVTLAGAEVAYTAPYATGEIYADTPVYAQRFYNPNQYPIEISNFFINIGSNTLDDTMSINVTINERPTIFDIKVLKRNTGSYNNDSGVEVLEPGEFIQFKIHTGSIPAGQIQFRNLSLVIQEHIRN